MSERPPNTVMWFAVLGGGLAYAAQFVAGYAFGIAQCQQPVHRWTLAVHGWDAGVSAAALLVAIASLIVALRIFFRTREVFDPVAQGDTTAEPVGRVQFLATLGLVVNPLAMAIIVMDGIGAPLLTLCHQS